MDRGTSINLPNHLHSLSGSESRADVRLEGERLGSVRMGTTLYTAYTHNDISSELMVSSFTGNIFPGILPLKRLVSFKQAIQLGECLTLLASGSDPTCHVGCVKCHTKITQKKRFDPEGLVSPIIMNHRHVFTQVETIFCLQATFLCTNHAMYAVYANHLY